MLAPKACLAAAILASLSDVCPAHSLDAADPPQVAVDGWRVPCVTTGIDAKELLINISRSILGPAGTEVVLKLQRAASSLDVHLARDARSDGGKSGDGIQGSSLEEPVRGSPEPGEISETECNDEIARGRRQTSFKVG